MRTLLDELYDLILKYVHKNQNLLGSPAIKRRSRDNYGILSSNFFFKDSVDVYSELLGISDETENTIRTHIGSEGEIIKGVLQKGEIWDGGKRYFEVKAGSILETYCFKCRSLTFTRITWEKQFFDPQKEWLSIDVDYIEDTLWFEEPQD